MTAISTYINPPPYCFRNHRNAGLGSEIDPPLFAAGEPSALSQINSAGSPARHILLQGGELYPMAGLIGSSVARVCRPPRGSAAGRGDGEQEVHGAVACSRRLNR